MPSDFRLECELVRAQLWRAFDGVPVPRQVVDGDGLDERVVVRNFGGKTRRDFKSIPCNLTEDLTYMSAEAIEYFLPLFLDHLARPENVDDFEVFIGTLSFLNRQQSEACGVRFPRFSEAQRNAIVGWLHLVNSHFDRYDADNFTGQSGRIPRIIETWST